MAYPPVMSVLAEQAISDAVEVLSPTGLNQLIQGRLTDLRGLRVRGEVSNVRTSNGHLYFELRDQSSRIRATAWRSTVQRQHLELRNGQEVICYGYLDLWVKGGT